ncbi:protein MAIN-LIKE 2-like [Abrus precatorius]|uniref:Protein MAIN-LIKE 2-like n=1 Tax=Abrus precatorius TaxID=3816 RepID=A0A8B8LPH5_ABRPR|nr:protein MAIN-LIKE 2-like [Abrus precatorius]
MFEHILDGWDYPILKVRKSQFILAGLDDTPQEIIPHSELVGFNGIAHICQFLLDLPLITALVKRWRLETHFSLASRRVYDHFAGYVLLGLRIDERPVIVSIRGNYAYIVEESLRIRPERDAFVGRFFRMSWLDQNFTHVAMHAQSPLQITRFARAYMLRLIDGFTLSDHSSNRVLVRYLPLLHDFAVTDEYSWGFAILRVF